MSPKLQNKLYKAFPRIFAQKDLPKEQTAMCWGVDVPDNWYKVIFNLCTLIQEYVDSNTGTRQVEAMQVKEKFGKLCFYTNYQNAYVSGLIKMADSLLPPPSKKYVVDKLLTTPSIGTEIVDKLREKIQGKRLS